jgi:hypothetical protein
MCKLPLFSNLSKPKDLKEYNKNRVELIKEARRLDTWAKNNQIFGRCECNPNHLTINGICQTCGFVKVCAWCTRVKLPNETFRFIPYEKSEAVSHGICPECKELQVELQINN